MLVRGTVFARMSPDQKAQLVEEFQTLGKIFIGGFPQSAWLNTNNDPPLL